ncbi:MAG: GreA/GreB family elongation factor [Nitratireductor sp.]
MPSSLSAPFQPGKTKRKNLTKSDPVCGDQSTLSPTKPVAEQPLVGRSDRIEIGDTVRLRYLTHGQDVIQVTISKHGNDPEKGLVGHAMPLAEAVLDAQEGDEIEVLNGSYLRSAVIEKVIKAKATA